MSKLNFSKGKLSKFISSKGFYVAVAVCLVGAGAATWLAVDRTITGIESSNNRVIASESWADANPLVEEAETKQSVIPKLPESSSSSPAVSTAPSSSTPQSKPVEESSSASAVSEESSAVLVTPSLVYSLPIRGNIINPYSGGELVKNITLNDWRTHDGIDIAAAKGDEVYAAADGVIAGIKQDPLWGTVITINHSDGTQTLYYGLSSETAVAEGDSVLIRQLIGTVDAIPSEIEQESHIHFAVKRDGEWIDPMDIVTHAD